MLGVLLGFVLSLMRTSESRMIYAVSSVYVEFFRGTPVLIQIFGSLLPADRVAYRNRQSGLGDHRTQPLHGCHLQRDEVSRRDEGDRPRPARCLRSTRPWPTHQDNLHHFSANHPACHTDAAVQHSQPVQGKLAGLGGRNVNLLYVGQNIATRTFHPVEILTTVAFIYFAIAFPLTRAVTVLEQELLRKIEA